jgi:hypothetical protein
VTQLVRGGKTVTKKLFLTTLAICALVVLAVGCGGAPVAAPTAYEKWDAEDGTFGIEYPAGWKAEGGGRHGVQWATFEQGSAKIEVDVSLSESLMGDIMGAGGGGVTMLGPGAPEDDQLEPPVAVIHAEKKKAFAENFSDYNEKEAVKITPPIGEGRKSEYTGTKGFGQVHGYRTSVLSNQRGITIICQCSDSDWPKLQPAFDKILESVTYGTRR